MSWGKKQKQKKQNWVGVYTLCPSSKKILKYGNASPLERSNSPLVNPRDLGRTNFARRIQFLNFDIEY